MKIIYTILFFTDTLLLVVFSYLFLKYFDNGTPIPTLVLLSIGIMIGIILLIYFVYNYLKIPQNNSLK